MSHYKFGIDMGGTTAKIGVVNQHNRLIEIKSVSSSGDPRPTALIRLIKTASKGLLRKFHIKRAGVGVAGDIDSKKGIVRVSPNLGWTKVHLKKMLETALHVPVLIDNDANVAAWGIYKTQVPPQVKNVMVLTLGTGVGGGIIYDGALVRGATGSAGEVGHMVMDPLGPKCNCGNKGCLETYAGGFHIARKVKADLSHGKKSSLSKLLKRDPALITPFEVAKAANANDSYAKSIWMDVGQMLGRAIGNLIYVFNPERIYLTGGVAQAGGLVLRPVHESLRTRAFQTPVRACRIQIAKEAPHIGVIGAALL